MSHSHLGFRARRHPSGVRERGMKTLCEFRIGRTIIVTGAMFAWAWASQQAHSQNSDCSNGCGTYAEYALAQRLHCRQYKTWLALKLPHGLVITGNIPAVESVDCRVCEIPGVSVGNVSKSLRI